MDTVDFLRAQGEMKAKKLEEEVKKKVEQQK
jgi:hypothetical protein